MDTEEMYRRGVADAEQGAPHPFYYEHYYHYRRGYNHARRRRYWSGEDPAARALVWRIALGAFVLALVGVGAYTLLGRRPQVASMAAAPTLAATRLPLATAARTPIFPTATPTTVPSPTPVVLQAGGRARVTNTGGRPLRGRDAPGLTAPTRVGFPEGEEVALLEGPVEADGYTWWRIEGPSGAAWSAQQAPDGALWLTPIGG
jgi:hypothetical protein